MYLRITKHSIGLHQSTRCNKSCWEVRVETLHRALCCAWCRPVHAVRHHVGHRPTDEANVNGWWGSPSRDTGFVTHRECPRGPGSWRAPATRQNCPSARSAGLRLLREAAPQAAPPPPAALSWAAAGGGGRIHLVGDGLPGFCVWVTGSLAERCFPVLQLYPLRSSAMFPSRWRWERSALPSQRLRRVLSLLPGSCTQVMPGHVQQKWELNCAFYSGKNHVILKKLCAERQSGANRAGPSSALNNLCLYFTEVF